MPREARKSEVGDKGISTKRPTTLKLRGASKTNPNDENQMGLFAFP